MKLEGGKGRKERPDRPTTAAFAGIPSTADVCVPPPLTTSKPAPLPDRFATPSTSPIRWVVLRCSRCSFLTPLARCRDLWGVPGAAYSAGGQGKRRQSVLFSTALSAFPSTHWTRSASQLAHTRRPSFQQFAALVLQTQVRGRYFSPVGAAVKWVRAPLNLGIFPSPPFFRGLSSLTLHFLSCPASSADCGHLQIQEQTHTGRPQ